MKLPSAPFNGRYKIEFQARGHKYLVDGRKEPTPSVSNISGWKDSVERLLQWHGKNILANLAASCNKNGSVSMRDLEALKGWKDNSAAERGTRVHKMCEDFILGNAVPEPEDEMDRNSYGHFITWYNKYGKDYEVLAVERMLYNPDDDYIGTCDFIGQHKDTGRILILDYKTSGRMQPSYFFQVAGYAQALELEMFELNLGGPEIDLGVLRLPTEDKNGKNFDFRVAEEYSNAAEVAYGGWNNCLALYRRTKEMTAQMKEIKHD